MATNCEACGHRTNEVSCLLGQLEEGLCCPLCRDKLLFSAYFSTSDPHPLFRADCKHWGYWLLFVACI